MKLLALIIFFFIVFAFSGKLADFGDNSPPAPIIQQEQQEILPGTTPLVVDPYKNFKSQIDTLSCDLLFVLKRRLVKLLEDKYSKDKLDLIDIVMEKIKKKECKKKE